jgi:hypothetical protein
MGHGKWAVVGKGEERLTDPQGVKEIPCFSVKEEGRFPQGVVYHLDISPSNSFTISQSNGLEKGLFGREPYGKTFGGPGLLVAAADLPFREDTDEKEVAPSGQEALDPFDIDNINARSKDHENSFES